MAESYTGYVVNGMIVLDEGTPDLPDGTKVRVLTESQSQATTDKLASTREWLLDLAREAELDPEAHSLPSDLAAQHDHYAHGKPRA